MKKISITIRDDLFGTIEKRMKDSGFTNRSEYIESLVRRGLQ